MSLTVTLLHTQDIQLSAREERCYIGEVLTYEIKMSTLTGSPRNCYGGTLHLYLGRSGTNSMCHFTIDGRASGVHTIAIPITITEWLDGTYNWYIIYEDALGETEQVISTSTIEFRSLVLNPTNPTIFDIELNGNFVYEQMIEFSAMLDLASGSLDQSARNPINVPYGVPTLFRIYVPQLQGSNQNLTATGFVRLSRNNATIGNSVTLTQESAGVFVGTLDTTLQQTIGLNSTAQYVIVITINGVNYAACLPSDITYFYTGIPINIDPTVTIISPSYGSSILSGSTTTVQFYATDISGTLNASNFALIIDNVVTSSTFTITSGSGTSVVFGETYALLNSGSHFINIRCTDNGDASALATTLVTVAAGNRIYHGVGATNLSGTTTIEATLTYNDISTTSSIQFVASPTNQKVYYACPVNLNILTWTCDGISVDELAPRSGTLHNANGALETFIIHESQYLLTGSNLPFILEFNNA